MNHSPLEALARQLLAGECSLETFLAQAGVGQAGVGQASGAQASGAQAGDTQPEQGTPPLDENACPTATVDLDRQRRCGFPEVIYGPGKPPEALVAIAAQILQRGQRVFATRVDQLQAELFCTRFSRGVHNPLARTLRVDPEPLATSPPEASSAEGDRPRQGKVAVISAGTSDLPVAEEARVTLEWMGVEVVMIYDVGVAGPHRLPERRSEFADVDAVVVVAGMEGALPSVVGGYADCPIFGVPTSVGYGANFGGTAALLSMLNSCASNVAVVNIDAGFKGGYLAGMVATRRARAGNS